VGLANARISHPAPFVTLLHVWLHADAEVFRLRTAFLLAIGLRVGPISSVSGWFGDYKTNSVLSFGWNEQKKSINKGRRSACWSSTTRSTVDAVDTSETVKNRPSVQSSGIVRPELNRRKSSTVEGRTVRTNHTDVRLLSTFRHHHNQPSSTIYVSCPVIGPDKR
jgi:hypothetical protein